MACANKVVCRQRGVSAYGVAAVRLRGRRGLAWMLPPVEQDTAHLRSCSCVFGGHRLTHGLLQELQGRLEGGVGRAAAAAAAAACMRGAAKRLWRRVVVGWFAGPTLQKMPEAVGWTQQRCAQRKGPSACSPPSPQSSPLTSTSEGTDASASTHVPWLVRRSLAYLHRGARFKVIK